MGGTWSNGLKPRFTKAFPRVASLRNITVFLNVVRYVDSDGNYITFMGEHYDENGGKIISCHYSFFMFDIESNEGFSCDSCGWEKPPELEKNARDLITLLLDIEPDFSINECHITPLLRKAPNHRCIRGRCASFSPLQRCGNVCGLIASIFSVIISKNPGLLISLSKAKGANSNHQLAYLKDVSSYNCLLRVVLMKWCLSGKFDLKDVVPATSGSTLNPIRKSAAISQNVGRSRKHENISLKSNKENIPSNDDSLYNSKKSNNTKGLFGKQNDNKNKNHGKNTVKDKLSSHCFDPTE